MLKKTWPILAAGIAALAFAAPAQAGTNTGWPCSTPNVWIHISGPNYYYCSAFTRTWWLMQPGW